MKYQELGKGIIRRREKRVLGIFVDGTGLDRATRRLNRRVDLAALVKGVSSGYTAAVARYYTLIPNEDDSRQRSFLDAVSRAGLSVVVKRLPPKGITRQVSVDVEMAADIVAFARGYTNFSSLSEVETNTDAVTTASSENGLAVAENATSKEKEIQSIVIVCPGRDLSYPISLAKEIGAETTTADFGKFNAGDILKSADRWIDLSDSETIWKEEPLRRVANFPSSEG